MKIDYRKRQTTNYIHVVTSKAPSVTFEETYRKARCQGKFDTGYHYFINEQGTVSEDRTISAIADHDLADHLTSIYILLSGEKLNDCQALSLRELLDTLQYEYPQAKIIKE